MVPLMESGGTFSTLYANVDFVNSLKIYCFYLFQVNLGNSIESPFPLKKYLILKLMAFIFRTKKAKFVEDMLP